MSADFAEEIFVKKNTWKNRFSPKFSWSFLELYIHSNLSIGWWSESYFHKKFTQANFYYVYRPANPTKQIYFQTAFKGSLKFKLTPANISDQKCSWIQAEIQEVLSTPPRFQISNCLDIWKTLANNHTTADVSKNNWGKVEHWFYIENQIG